MKRTNYCGDFRIDDVGKKVVLCGWVQKQRDMGQLIFIDLRDRSGIVQLAFDEKTDKETFKKAFELRAEFVVEVSGVVKERESKNKVIPTGDVEIEVTDLNVISEASTPPFEIVENSNVKDETRFKYRYLDLRRPDVQSKIIARHKIVKLVRDYFDANGFIEIETPMLIKSTPEGARDYLVPSRVHKGSFFALPQSPQLYKQLCMLAGFDRYMQIARCFRDEDLRADRQPEFTQIDFEMSFIEKEEVMQMSEDLVKLLYKKILNIDLIEPFQKIKYDEAMRRFGSDKPDIRFEMELVDLKDVLRGSEFKVFSSAIDNGGTVMAVVAKNSADKFTRKEIDKLTSWIKDYGAKGLAWTKINEDGTSSSSYEKFLSEAEIAETRLEVEAQNGDVIFVVASENKQVVFESLGALRCELAERLNLIDKSKPRLLWVTDFPLFEYDDEEKRFVAKHHPFTAPRDEDVDKIVSDPGSVYAKAYDLVLNGCEVGGGSIRINDPDLQKKMLSVLGFSDDEAEKRFGFLIDAFKYGAPIHGGMAFGLDRLVMLMLGCDSIRDVIAFPKMASSAELMTAAPSTVDKQQLDDLGIKI